MNNEPVAWFYFGMGFMAGHVFWWIVLAILRKIEALKGNKLTNKEIEDEWFKVFKPESGIGKNLTNGVYDFARAILRKAQEK